MTWRDVTYCPRLPSLAVSRDRRNPLRESSIEGRIQLNSHFSRRREQCQLAYVVGTAGSELQEHRYSQ